MASTLTFPVATGVCETCAERGRPDQPVYKIGLCEFCYRGVPHPNATLEQRTEEGLGARGTDAVGMFVKPASVSTTVRGSRSEQALARARENFVLLRTELAEREQFLVNMSIDLLVFEREYVRRIGILYSTLDEWTARIRHDLATAEDSRSVAAGTRAPFGESGAAVRGEQPVSQDLVSTVEMRAMYRAVAARSHRDLVTNTGDCIKCEPQKAEPEPALQSSNADPRKRILREYRNNRKSGRRSVICPNLVRAKLQMKQVKSRLSQVEMETAVLRELDVARLKDTVEAAKSEGRELLDELAQELGLRTELLRSLSQACSSQIGKEIAGADEWPSALLARESVTLNSKRSATLVRRGLIDLKTEEEAAEDWERRGLLIESESGHGEANFGSWSGFRLRNDPLPLRVARGRKYLRGLALTLDYGGAAALFRRAAEQGHGHAANSLGFLYEHGLGVDQDYEQAFAWYFNAAGRGVAKAQFNLDKLYDNGRGIARGYAQAAKNWYRTAAGNCDVTDHRNLGLMYALGKGVPPEDAEAAFWFRRAAQQGDAIAQEQLGLMYALGKGMPKNHAEAIFWCCKAATQGYGPAHDALQILSRNRRAHCARSASRFPRSLLGKKPTVVALRSQIVETNCSGSCAEHFGCLSCSA